MDILTDSMLEIDISIDSDMLEEYKKLFKNTTNYNPYPYQEIIFSLINSLDVQFS